MTNEEKYAAYLKPATIQEDGESVEVLVAHAWLEVQDAHLDAKIPAARILQQWKQISSDVSLRDFALQIIDLVGPTSLVMLAARDAGGGRKGHTTADDLDTWVAEVIPFGYKATDLLTDEQKAVIEAEKGVVI